MSLRWVLFDWGDTLMSENGPADIPMALWPDVRAIDGAHEVLLRLHPRYRIAVATNATVSDRPMILRALERVGLVDLVSELFCHRELLVKKSDAAFWEAVVKRLGVAPDELIMVGDDLAEDVLAPRRCGIRSVWFNWKRVAAPAGLELAVIESLRELLPLVGL